MSFLTMWTEKLIIIILIAVLMELFLPANRFQPYVKIVMGLLIVLIMLQPITDLLHLNTNGEIKVPSSNKYGSVEKNQIKKMKSEIDQQDAAYIHKQMVVQLKDKVNKEVQRSFGYAIVTINLQTIPTSNAAKFQIKHMTVVVKKAQHHGKKTASDITVPAVTPVRIEDKLPESGQSLPKSVSNELKRYLSTNWGVDSSKLVIKAIGG